MNRLENILTRDRLESLLREFKREQGGRFSLTALGYFGSYARGEAGTTSDVDVVYRLEESAKPTLFSLVEFQEELTRRLQHPVDLIEYREQLPPRLKRRIATEAIYV